MDDLDDLLDSALDDFQKVGITRPSGATSSSSSGTESVSKERGAQQPQGDQPGPSGSDGGPGERLGLGLGLGLPGLATTGRKKTARAKGTSSSTNGTNNSRAAAAREMGMPPMDGPLSATLEKLAQQTRETVGNIDAVGEDDMMGEDLMENLMKQFEEVGGAQDIQSVMDTMMRQLLSKEVLHEPMKEIGQRYPQWLAANKSQISEEEYNRFSRQHQFILQLCDVYESTPGDFQRIMDLMQSMQNCGQPPSDLVKELAPGVDLDQEGVPIFPDFSALGTGGQPNCGIM